MTETRGQGKPRIAPVKGSPDGVPVSERLGRPLNLFLTLAHHDRLIPAITFLGGTITGDAALLPVPLRELMILRTGWRTRTRYEVSQHLVMARTAGVDSEKIHAATTTDLSSFTPVEADLLLAVDELCATDRISSAIWERLAATWSVPELLEMIVVVGFYRMIAGVLNSAEVEVEVEIPPAW